MSLKDRINKDRAERRLQTAEENNKGVNFTPGMRVVIRNEEWKVLEVATNEQGVRVVTCVCESDFLRGKICNFFSNIDTIEEMDPRDVTFIEDTSSHFSKIKLFLDSYIRKTTQADNNIHIAHRALIDSRTYQLLPTQIALNKPRTRLLLSDETGLGKIIETGILISELLLRGAGQRILIVTIRSKLEKIQREFWSRFTIPLTNIDYECINNLKNKLVKTANPFNYYDKAIISYDMIKNNVNLSKFIDESRWDIIVIDEAHNISNPKFNQTQITLSTTTIRRHDTTNYENAIDDKVLFAEKFAKLSETLILLTSSPHDGKNEILTSLLNIIDPKVGILECNLSKEDVRNLCIYRTKEDVRIQKPTLTLLNDEATNESTHSSTAEETIFSKLANLHLEIDVASKNIPHDKANLIKTEIKKSLYSSPVACAKYLENKLNEINNAHDPRFDDDIASLTDLKKSLDSIEKSSFSRYNKLLEIIKRKVYGWSAKSSDRRLVIFTSFNETTKFLVTNLKNDLKLSDKEISAIDTTMSDDAQNNIVYQFGQKNSQISILVVTDLVLRGIKIQYNNCHRIIHFDIPWSLIVFKLRNNITYFTSDTEPVDIRYISIVSEESEILNDMQILKSIIKRNSEISGNYGDLSMIELQENSTAKAIEDKLSTEEFLKEQRKADDFEIFEDLLRSESMQDISIKTVNHHSIFRDVDYVKLGLPLALELMFGENSDNMEFKANLNISNLKICEGIEIEVTNELKKALGSYMPSEFWPSLREKLELVSDRNYIKTFIENALQNSQCLVSITGTQYLWELHPIVLWLNDKLNYCYKRNEAPIIALEKGLERDETLFVIAGYATNKRAVKIINEWFAISFKGSKYNGIISFNELLKRTSLNSTNIKRKFFVVAKKIEKIERYISLVVKISLDHISKLINEYKERTYGKKESERIKLNEIKDYLFMNAEELLANKKYSKDFISKEIEKAEIIYNEYCDLVMKNLELSESPCVRIMACITDANSM
ncbi:MAG: DEAD/DEAH box helicase family protein [Christensenellaceae bacterium]|jgi:hypothetical protein|nr:DEAD/DEAH box helicase family protein [Christensenellaceae bacterium]